MIQTSIEHLDLLQLLLNHQADAQRRVYGTDPSTMDTPGKLEYIRWNTLALEDELHEMLAEVSWKPWAKAEFIHGDKATNELIDALHFLMNLFLALAPAGTSPSELANDLFERYERKRAINAARQRHDYDGVATKCTGCQRALDDPGMVFINTAKHQTECAVCSAIIPPDVVEQLNTAHAQ